MPRRARRRGPLFTPVRTFAALSLFTLVAVAPPGAATSTHMATAPATTPPKTPASAKTSAPTTPTAPTTGPLARHPSAALARQSETVAADGIFSLDVDVTDLESLATTQDVELAVTVHQRVKTLTGFSRTLLGSELGSVLGLVAPTPVKHTSGSTTQTIRVSVPIGSPSAACPDCTALGLDGVYPLHVELRERGGELVYDSFTTHLVYATRINTNRLAVALIVRLHLPPGMTSNGTLAVAPVRFSGHAEALLNHPLVPLTVIPTPETIATIAEGGDPGIIDLVRGAVSGREVLSSTWVPWHLADLDDPRLVDELRRQSKAGRDVLRRVLGVTPTDGILVADRAIPNRRALDALDITRIAAPERALAKSGSIVGPGRPVAFDPGPLDEGATDEGATPALPLVVLDDRLQSHFTARLSDRRPGTDDVLRAQQLLADLAMLHFDAPNRPGGVAIVIPEDTPQGVLDLLLAGIGADGQTVRAVPLSAIFNFEPRTTADGGAVERKAASTRPGASSPDGVVQDSLRTRTELDGYRSAFVDVQPEDTRFDDQIGRSFSADLGSDARRAYLAGVDASVRSSLAKVHLARPDRVTLTARRQDVPIVVENTSGRPVRLALEVSSDNLTLPHAVAASSGPLRGVERREVMVRGRIGQEKVSVATRGPGSFSFVARLRTRSGFDLSIKRYTVRSTVVSGIGKALTLGALAFLGVWWSRSAVRARRRRAAPGHPARTSRKQTQ